MSKKAGDYWQNRFIELENRIKKEGIGDIKDLERRYQKAIYDVQKDLNVWYSRLAKNNGDISLVEARKLLNKNELEEFHWTVDEYIKHGKENALNKAWIKELENASAKTHIKRLEAIKLQTRQRVEELFAGREEQLAGTLKGAYKESFYRTGYELAKGTGVAMSFSKLDDNLVEKIIKTPWAPDGASFSSRIWKDKARLITELQAEVDRVCIAGVNPKSSINNIVNKLNASKANAKRLVMTELSAAQTRAQQSCMSDIGVERYKYVATLDLKTSEICAELDGKTFEMQDMQIGVNAPPMHPHCRSCTCPDIDSEWSGGKRAARGEDGKTYYVPADITYKNWEKQFVNDAKEEVLSDVRDIAKNLISRHKGLEPFITSDLINVATTSGGKMEGLEYRLKTQDSLERKIMSDAAEKKVSYNEASTQIKDVLRYTIVNSENHFAEGYFLAVEELNKKGYNIKRVKNTFFEGEVYKGINTLLCDKKGNMFELQFHTQDSYELKVGKLHKLYEKYRKLDIESEEAKVIKHKMIKLSEAIKNPKGVEKIRGV